MRLKLVCLFSMILLGLPCVAQNALGQSGITYTALPDAPSPCFAGNRANGINPRGDIVGRCQDSVGPRSWILAKGSSTPVLIDFSSAPFTPTFGSTTRAINSRGDIVGRYFDASQHSHGYLLSGGVFSSIDAPFPGTTDTDARGINNAGTIVGEYDVPTNIPGLGTVGLPNGFIRDAAGNFTQIHFPNSAATIVRGNNDSGDVVGWYIIITNASSLTIAVHAFLLSKGVYSSFDVPGATGTIANGVNEQGEITGSYTTAPVTISSLLGDSLNNARGYVRGVDGATFTLIDFPGALATDCRGGFNPRGDLVGVYLDSGSHEHGFVAHE
jgi:uncharacterized membrane protein